MVTTPDAANDVVSQLRSALERCDELTFNETPDAFAYLLWHQIDRYHRVSQTLDRLFQLGILPLAKPGRPLRVLEVGSGPAPASYAAIDYYAVLADWAKSRSEVFQISSNTEAHTLDRGRAWQQIVHGLSEELLNIEDRQSLRERGPFRTRFFNITYPEFENFSPGQLHINARERMKREILDEDELWQFQLDTDYQDLNQYAATRVSPSAYDLIIVANFVTSSSMMDSFKAELENLANSLVPGGILLTLSGRNQKYKDLWKDYAALPHVNRLEHVVDEVMQAHQDPEVHGRVTRSTVSLLTHLEVLAEQGLDKAELPQDINEAMRLPLTDPSSIASVQAVTYPTFQVHGFVRRDRAISTRDRKRIAGRRGADADA